MNMIEMLKEENEDFPQFIAYSKFISELEDILGYEIDRNGLPFDLFSDGASPQDAADEILAAKSAENDGAENVFAVISFEQNKVVAETTHYQEAARVCNELDASWIKSNPDFASGRLPHTVCRIDSIHIHERKHGKLNR